MIWVILGKRARGGAGRLRGRREGGIVEDGMGYGLKWGMSQ